MLRSMIVLGAAAVVGALAFFPCAQTATANTPDAATVHQSSEPGLIAAEEKPCARTEFKTELVKKACAEGGQKAARKAMMGFMKEAKKAHPDAKITCKSCHTKPSGDFPLTSDGLELYKKYGGK